MTDRERFLNTAKGYIGTNGNFVCNTKLGLGAVYDWCAFAVSAVSDAPAAAPEATAQEAEAEQEAAAPAADSGNAKGLGLLEVTTRFHTRTNYISRFAT